MIKHFIYQTQLKITLDYFLKVNSKSKILLQIRLFNIGKNSQKGVSENFDLRYIIKIKAEFCFQLVCKEREGALLPYHLS